MSRKFKFHNKEGLYFVSFATVNWIDVFVREQYCLALIASWAIAENKKEWKFIAGALCQAMCI